TGTAVEALTPSISALISAVPSSWAVTTAYCLPVVSVSAARTVTTAESLLDQLKSTPRTHAPLAAYATANSWPVCPRLVSRPDSVSSDTAATITRTVKVVSGVPVGVGYTTRTEAVPRAWPKSPRPVGSTRTTVESRLSRWYEGFGSA